MLVNTTKKELSQDDQFAQEEFAGTVYMKQCRSLIENNNTTTLLESPNGLESIPHCEKLLEYQRLFSALFR